MCDCIAQIEHEVETEHNAVFAQFEHSGSQSSMIRYVPFKKDGTKSKVSRYESRDWDYCPFCGKGI